MKRILLVEDEAGHAELIQRALEAEPGRYAVSRATTLVQARRLLAQATFDLALVDYRLPDGLGDQLVAGAREAFPVLLMTAFGSERAAVEAIKAGALDYIVKSSEAFADMPHLVERALREWEHRCERRLAEGRLEALNQVLLSLGPGFEESAQRLVRLLGEQLKAHFVLYQRIDGRVLQLAAGWQVPSACQAPESVDNSIYRAVLGCGEGQALFLADLNGPPYIDELPCIRSLDLRSFLGQAIRCGERVVGVLGVFFDRCHALSNTDRRLLGILASALSTEEKRHQAEFERQQIERARLRLETQLRQAQKMEAVGQLAGGIAHDFNNILAAIMMQLGLLQANPRVEPVIREALRDVELHAQRAASLTRQLLMFSRQSVIRLQSVDLNSVVENLLKMLRRLLGEHIRVEFLPAEGPLWVEADVGMLEQVIMNLAVNARDAMPKGGRLSLVADTIDLDPPPDPKSERKPGRYARLRVSDTGCGMTEAVLKRVFEPFFTTKEIGKGTGLGLATVYGIARQHQGWVEVSSQVGQGTTFSVLLPASQNAAPQQPVVETAVAVPRGHETILLVEDEPAVRRLVEHGLRQLGYRVLVANNGREAMALWPTFRADIQLLFTDMVMPEGTSGLELAQQLRRDNPRLKVIISSGYSPDGSDSANLAELGIAYLPKPFETRVLGEAVRACLDAKPELASP